jgi:hypothetical protein
VIEGLRIDMIANQLTRHLESRIQCELLAPLEPGLATTEESSGHGGRP